MNGFPRADIRRWKIKQRDAPVKDVKKIKNELSGLKLSIRASTICRQNGLLNIDLIMIHYQEFKTFGMFRGCGKMTNNELVSFCRESISLSYRYRCLPCISELDKFSEADPGKFCRVTRDINVIPAPYCKVS
jgi:hypothetical protein